MHTVEHYPRADIGAANCLANRVAEAELLGHDPGYTPPERTGHYRGLYRWDETKIAIIYARSRREQFIRAGESGLKTLLAGQFPNGQIPNQQHIEGKRRFDPENRAGHESADHSNYGQPPLEGQAVLEIHQAKQTQSPKDAAVFLREVIERTGRAYRYLDINRSNGPGDKLIGIIRGEESGRDSGPEWDFSRPLRLPTWGANTWRPIGISNMAINYAYRLGLARKIKKTGGDIERAREIFWVNDIEVNCIYAINCYVMAELARLDGQPESEIKYFARLGEKVESQILQAHTDQPESPRGMWFPEAAGGQGRFYALNKDGQPIKEVTVANLIVLWLPNLGEDQLKSTLDLIDQSFTGPNGLPSVATDSPKYDPHYREPESIWRGPGWSDQDWMVCEGLLLQINRQQYDLRHRPDLIQRCKEVLWRLTAANTKIFDNWADRNIPIPEFYDTENGRPHRLWRVQHFAWNNLAYVMPPDTAPNVVTRALLKYLKSRSQK
jgi:hypothetical protein